MLLQWSTLTGPGHACPDCGSIAARCGNFLTAEYLATHGNQLASYFAAHCPFCSLLVAPEDSCPETLEHLLLRCPAWVESRTRWLTPVMEFIRRITPAVDDINLSLLILGGSNGVVSAPTFWFSGPNPAYVAVAHFLQEIVLVRAAKLETIGKCPRFLALFGTQPVPDDFLIDASIPTHHQSTRDPLLEHFSDEDDSSVASSPCPPSPGPRSHNPLPTAFPIDPLSTF